MEKIKQEHEKNVMARLDRNNPTIKDVGDAVKLIIDKMWTEKHMAEFIEQQHNRLCKKCPRVGAKSLSTKIIVALVSAISGLVGVIGTLAASLVK